VTDERENRPTNDFAAEASKPQAGLATEFWQFLRDNKKWWLAPIVISILGLGLLVLLGGTAAAPFIYTLF
jgi:predicted cobalt transporter CbtA